jgi:vanillate O-demethylase monooxygenase subunit
VKQLPIMQPDVLRYPHPVLLASKLRRGAVRSFILLGKSYVLFRDRAGRVVAAPGACPHRGAVLAKGKVNRDGELVCAYHGWRIRGDGCAVSPSTPGKSCNVAVLKTWERHGFIWVANPDVPDSAFPAFIEPGHKIVAKFTSVFAAPLRVVLDNFGEVEHAFQIHRFIGPSRDGLATTEFSVEAGPEETRALFSCDYRGLPLGLGRWFGIAPGDRYHNDWTFRFRPLFGCYSNYWTAKRDGQRRPVSFIVTSFLVPTTPGQVDVHVILQISVTGGLPRLVAPLIEWFAAAVVRYEIWADSRIARFAPEAAEADGQSWQLTGWDKQIFLNRKLLEAVYLGGQPAEHGRTAYPMTASSGAHIPLRESK